jgi:hypothetical protein
MFPAQARTILMAVTSLSFAFSVASAQNPPVSGQPPISIIGTVVSVSANVIYVRTGTQSVTLSSDAHTEVWKGKVFHDLSPVVVGDNVIARYRTEGSGKLVTQAMWLNIVNFFGVITKIADDGFEMFTNPNADPKSAYKKETKNVSVDADTVFEASAKDDLKSGRGVQVVGLDLRGGRILATRLTVYEGSRPVRMGNARVILPNGQNR